MLQILVCERAQVHTVGICPEVCVHAPVCVCVGGGWREFDGSWGGGGNLLRAVADVSVSSDHSACSACEAPTLHEGVCKREHGSGCFAQRSRIRAMRKNAPQNPKDPSVISSFLLSLCAVH